MILFSALLLVHTAPLGDPPREEDANIVRVYELSAALPWRMSNEGTETLLPFLALHHGEEQSGWDPGWASDQLIEQLRNLSGQQFDYEGREIGIDSRGRLVVRAPAAMQERTERYLQFLEGAFGAVTELAIDAVEMPEGAASGAAGAALVPVAEAVRQIEQGARRRSWRLQLRAGSTARLDLTRASPMLVDYNVEIAQCAGVQDPIVEEVAVGARILARAAPASGGLWLALILRRGDPLSEVRDRDLPIRFLAGTEKGLDYHDGARTMQTIDVLNRSLALNTFVPEGKALAIQSALERDGRVHAETIFVRRAAGALPIFQRVSLDPKGGGRDADLLFVNLHTAQPPYCVVDSSMVSGETLPRSWTLAWSFDSAPFATARFGDEDLDRVREAVRADDDSVLMQAFGPCLLLSADTSSGPPEPGAKRIQPEERVERLARFAPPARVVQVSATLRRPGAAAPAARWTLPVRAGETAAAVIGSESFVVGDYDVEVAQAATIADPQMRVAFDGLALWLQPSISGSGEVTLQVSVRAHVRHGEARELDLRVPSFSKIDQASYDQLFAREKLSFGKGEGGPRRILLGDVSGQAGLSLEIEAAEVK